MKLMTILLLTLTVLSVMTTAHANDRYFVTGQGERRGLTAADSLDCNGDKNLEIEANLISSAKTNADMDAKYNCAQINFASAVRVQEYKTSSACSAYGTLLVVNANSIYECK